MGLQSRVCYARGFAGTQNLVLHLLSPSHSFPHWVDVMHGLATGLTVEACTGRIRQATLPQAHQPSNASQAQHLPAAADGSAAGIASCKDAYTLRHKQDLRTQVCLEVSARHWLPCTRQNSTAAHLLGIRSLRQWECDMCSHDGCSTALEHHLPAMLGRRPAAQDPLCQRGVQAQGLPDLPQPAAICFLPAVGMASQVTHELSAADAGMTSISCARGHQHKINALSSGYALL